MAEDDSNEPKEAPKEGKPWLALSLILLIVPVITLAITELVVIPRLQSSMAPSKADKPTTTARGATSAAGGEAFSTYRFDELVANLAGTMGSRFIKVSFEVRGKDPELTKMIGSKSPVVTDAIITTLSSVSIQSLEVPGGRNRMRQSLIEAVNDALGSEMVAELYFTEFIIQ